MKNDITLKGKKKEKKSKIKVTVQKMFHRGLKKCILTSSKTLCLEIL